MVESSTDSYGPSPLIKGRKIEAWRLLTTRLDLTNSYLLPRQFIGTHYTHNAVHSHRLDQSQLDHFYINDKAQWIHAIHSLEHVQNQSLLDHDPIILIVQISPLALQAPRNQPTSKLTRTPSSLQALLVLSKKYGKTTPLCFL